MNRNFTKNHKTCEYIITHSQELIYTHLSVIGPIEYVPNETFLAGVDILDVGEVFEYEP